MKDHKTHSLSDDELALLGALAAGEGEGGERALAGEAIDELAAHRALVSELRALPEAPSPNWRQLEASIRQACGEVPVKKWWSWGALRDAWRLPTLGLGAAAMASLALLLWARAPKPAEAPIDAAVPGQPALKLDAPVTPPIAQPVAQGAGDAATAMLLDDELIDDIDERGVDALVQQLPSEAALTLGATEDDSEDGEELLPSGSYDDEIERLDDEALRALGRWLDAEQKG
jgi:hypothetical protein